MSIKHFIFKFIVSRFELPGLLSGSHRATGLVQSGGIYSEILHYDKSSVNSLYFNSSNTVSCMYVLHIL